MELPGIGKQCSLIECSQLDFLPFTCDSCTKVFCKDHVGYEKHSCTESYKKDVRVPVCPLCNQPVSFKPGELPDRRVNDHIENDCKSDLALAKRKTYTNKCSVKGCKQRELVPVSCATCKKNYCLRHRHENDHECLPGVPIGKSKKSAASTAAGQAAASRFESFNTSRRTQPQKTSMSSVGSELNRERQMRHNKNIFPTRPQPKPTNQTAVPNGMTEDEAMAFAIQASLSENPMPSDSTETTESKNADDDEDLALARALAQSEIDERDRLSRMRQQQQQQDQRRNKDSGCCVT